MIELTLQQQMWLAVVDKGVLALVLVGVGYLANRRLERFKSREALRARLDEQRAAKAAELTQQLERLSVATQQYARQVYAFVMNEIGDWQWHKSKSVGELLVDDAVELARIEAVAKYQPTYLHLMKSANDISQQLAGARFWLGSQLSETLSASLLRSQLYLGRPLEEMAELAWIGARALESLTQARSGNWWDLHVARFWNAVLYRWRNRDKPRPEAAIYALTIDGIVDQTHSKEP